VKRRSKTPPRQEEDDGRTPEERAADHMLKDSFPASDPPSTSGGSATPNDPARELHREEDKRTEDED
jgi:hypothetical protein